MSDLIQVMGSHNQVLLDMTNLSDTSEVTDVILFQLLQFSAIKQQQYCFFFFLLVHLYCIVICVLDDHYPLIDALM